MSRFVAIACTAETLYALDEDGRVWTYFPSRSGDSRWKQLSERRDQPERRAA